MRQTVRSIITENIKKLCLVNNLKKGELSLILVFDNLYISKLEKSRINITIDRLEKIANYFETETYKLLK